MKRIDFEHEGQKKVANLYYDFTVLEDCVTVRFKNLWNDIVFSKLYGMWTSVSDLQTRYPKTYSNVQKAIGLTFGWN